MTAALAVLFMALQIADWWTTRRFLAAGIPEYFPQIRWIIKHFGMAGLLVFKIVYGAIIVAIFSNVFIFWGVPIVLALACAGYVWVVRWNYKRGNK